MTFNVDGQEITRKMFWNANNNSTKIKQKLQEEKYKDSRYDIVRTKIRRYEYDYIEEYIEMLADGRITKIKGNDTVTFNVEGQEITRKMFWKSNQNSTKIKQKLQEGKYNNPKYDIARRKIEDYKEKNENIPLEQLIEEYIEMLADDRITEIRSADTVTFNIEGQEVIRKVFWSTNNNSTKIKQKLQEEKYKDSKYDIARKKTRDYEIKNENIPQEQLIEEYIEMLADDRITEIRSADTVTFNVENQEIIRTQYWNHNSTKIKEKLKEEKYKDSRYDIVRTKIKQYEFNYIEEYIEMLADGRIKEIKANDSVTFNIEGQEVIRKSFWNANNNKIKRKIEEEKYKDSKYDIVREKIKDYEKKGNDIKLNQLMEEYIEMLADGRIKEIKSRDSVTFNIDGKEVTRIKFWCINKNSTKIKEKLKEEKYKDSRYDIVRAKIRRYEYDYIEEYIEMLADGRITKIKGNDTVTFNVEGQEITRKMFWKSNQNSTKIKQKLQEEKYKDSRYDIARVKVEAALNIKQNKEKIEQLCIEFGIDYKKNKKYLDKLSSSIFEAILKFFKEEKQISYIDENGSLISDFYMSNADFKEAHGKSFEDLLNNQKRM